MYENQVTLWWFVYLVKFNYVHDSVCANLGLHLQNMSILWLQNFVKELAATCMKFTTEMFGSFTVLPTLGKLDY